MDDTNGPSGIMELVLGIILSVVAIVWLLFPFIVNSWLKKIHDQIADSTIETSKLVQEATKTNQLLAQTIALGRPNSTSVTRKTAPVPLPEPASPSKTLSISKDGQNIGEYTVNNVRHMLKTKQLTLQDMYFDPATQEWISLDLHPSLY